MPANSEFTVAVQRLKKARARLWDAPGDRPFDAKSLARHLLYARTASPEDLLHDMGRLKAFDRKSEALTERLRWWRLLAFTLILVSFFVGFGVHGSIGVAVLWMLPASLVTLFFWLRVAVSKRTDLQDRRYRLAERLIRLLKVDVRPHGKLTVRLDFRRYDMMAPHRRYTNSGDWKVREYLHEWGVLEGRLADGSKFRFAVKNRVRDALRFRVNARGKTKVKHKRKKRTYFRLQVFPQAACLPQLAQMTADMGEAVQLPTWAPIKDMTISRKALSLTTQTDVNWLTTGEGDNPDCAVHLSAMMFLSLFHVVNLAKALAARQP